MIINENTKLTDILAAYPWLPDELARTEPRAKPFLAMMNTSFARTALKKATVADAARYLRRPAGRLLSRLEAVIRSYESRH